MRMLIVALLAMYALAGCGPPGGSQPPDTPVRGVNYVGVVVSDLDRTEQLLSEAAALKRVETAGELSGDHWDSLAQRENVRAETRLLRSSNGQVRLIQFSAPSARAAAEPLVGVQGPGIAHLCIQAAKDTATYPKFLDHGASPIGDPDMVQLNPRNPVEYAYVRDQDGVTYEIEHVDVEALDLEEPPQNTHRLRHVALATPDLGRAVAFYSILFDEPNPRLIGRLGGFSGENIDRVSGLEGSKIKMAWFQVRNMELEISQYVSHPTEASKGGRPVDALGLNMIVYDVVDVAAARDRLIVAGAGDVTAIINDDNGRIVFGRDPDGNLLGFQEVPSTSVFSSQNFADNGI